MAIMKQNEKKIKEKKKLKHTTKIAAPSAHYLSPNTF